MPHAVMILAAPDYEDLELWYSKLRLEEAGYEIHVAGLGDEEVRGKHGYPCAVDGHVADFATESLLGVVVPGGWAADALRRDPAVLQTIRAVHAAGGMIAGIGHGPWVLISTGIVRGRRMTATLGIRDDLVNAGAEWTQAPVVIDGNIISSRLPRDLPAFGQAMVEFLNHRASRSTMRPEPR